MIKLSSLRGRNIRRRYFEKYFIKAMGGKKLLVIFTIRNVATINNKVIEINNSIELIW